MTWDNTIGETGLGTHSGGKRFESLVITVRRIHTLVIYLDPTHCELVILLEKTFMQLDHLHIGEYGHLLLILYHSLQVSSGDRDQRAKTALCTMGASVFR